MNFDWEEYLNLADWLYKNCKTPGSEEACYRAAISRAYYAAFQCALEFAEDEEGYEPKGNATDHQLVAQHFYEKNNKERNFIFTQLGRLRDNRNKADYAPTLGNSSSTAYYTIDTARKVLQKLDYLKKT